MQFAVIGLGKFGGTVARTLVKYNCEVLAIDIDEKVVQEASSEINHVICADSTDDKTLKALITSDFDGAIISIGQNFEASILTLIILKEIGVKKVVVKAMSKTQAKILQKLGADKVVFPEVEVGKKLAHSLVNPGLHDFLELSDEYGIAEIKPPKEIIGKSIKEAAVRNRYNINIIAIKSRKGNKEKWEVNPLPDRVISENDKLVVIGKVEKIKNIF